MIPPRDPGFCSGLGDDGHRVHPDSTFAGRWRGTCQVDLSRILVLWCLNDIYSSAGPLPDPDQTVRDMGGSFLSLARRHLHVYQFLKATLFDRPRRYWEYDSRLYREELLVSHSAGDIAAIAALGSERRIEVTVVLLPYEYQLRQGRGDDIWLPQERMSARLRATGIIPLDPSPYLLDRVKDPAELFLYGDGDPLLVEGHELISRFLREQAA